MNPLEDRIQKVPLLKPDHAWRREIHDTAARGTGGGWKEWLWPSPLAWAALVPIWFVLAGASAIESRGSRAAAAANPVRIDVPPESGELRALLAHRR